MTLPTNFKCARFEADKDTQIIRNLANDVDRARFKVSGEEIELPVKLGLRLDRVPLAKWSDAARGQLSVHHQDRYADRAGSRAF